MRDKRKKFVELAEKRVNNALRVIRLISNLANSKNYDYEENHAKEIVSALEREIRHLKQAFQSNGTSRDYEFRLTN